MCCTLQGPTLVARKVWIPRGANRVLFDELASLRHAWEERLAAYREIEATWFSEPETLSRHYRLQYLALRRGISAGQAWLGWLDEAETLLRNPETRAPRGVPLVERSFPSSWAKA